MQRRYREPSLTCCQAVRMTALAQRIDQNSRLRSMLNVHRPPRANPRATWQRRFREINDWEHYLTDQGYRFVKLFLNVSKEEQRRRFLTRIDEPDRGAR